jgi:hypothetical protein
VRQIGQGDDREGLAVLAPFPQQGDRPRRVAGAVHHRQIEEAPTRGVSRELPVGMEFHLMGRQGQLQNPAPL